MKPERIWVNVYTGSEAVTSAHTDKAQAERYFAGNGSVDHKAVEYVLAPTPRKVLYWVVRRTTAAYALWLSTDCSGDIGFYHSDNKRPKTVLRFSDKPDPSTLATILRRHELSTAGVKAVPVYAKASE